MMILIDTNVLLRSVEQGHVHQYAAIAAMDILYDDHELIVVPQVLYEFWKVATSSTDTNGLNLSVGRVITNVKWFYNRFDILHDSIDVFWDWFALVSDHGIRGRVAHDIHLVASMRDHGIETILTFNGPDFASFAGIIVLDPLSVTTP